MDFQYRKRFKEYEDEFFVEGMELVEIYYRESYSKNVPNNFMLHSFIIDRVTPKKVFFGGQLLKDKVGLIESHRLFIPKQDLEEGLQFMIESFEDYLDSKIETLQYRLNRLHEADKPNTKQEMGN